MKKPAKNLLMAQKSPGLRLMLCQAVGTIILRLQKIFSRCVLQAGTPLRFFSPCFYNMPVGGVKKKIINCCAGTAEVFCTKIQPFALEKW